MFDEILEIYKLEKVWGWFEKLNLSNNLPYHNLFHAKCMVENCYDGAQHHNMPYEATKLLLTAAMYHDFNHSGGALPDSENIKRAYHGVRGIFAEPHNIIVRCIRCTEYPFIRIPRTLEERIIRDADLMQFRYDNWLEMYEDGLHKEVEVKLGREVTKSDMYWGNRRFWLEDAQFFTEWGNKVFETEGAALREHYAL
jgi:hypothetical protein